MDMNLMLIIVQEKDAAGLAAALKKNMKIKGQIHDS